MPITFKYGNPGLLIGAAYAGGQNKYRNRQEEIRRKREQDQIDFAQDAYLQSQNFGNKREIARDKFGNQMVLQRDRFGNLMQMQEDRQAWGLDMQGRRIDAAGNLLDRRQEFQQGQQGRAFEFQQGQQGRAFEFQQGQQDRAFGQQNRMADQRTQAKIDQDILGRLDRDEWIFNSPMDRKDYYDIQNKISVLKKEKDFDAGRKTPAIIELEAEASRLLRQGRAIERPKPMDVHAEKAQRQQVTDEQKEKAQIATRIDSIERGLASQRLKLRQMADEYGKPRYKSEKEIEDQLRADNPRAFAFLESQAAPAAAAPPAAVAPPVAAPPAAVTPPPAAATAPAAAPMPTGPDPFANPPASGWQPNPNDVRHDPSQGLKGTGYLGVLTGKDGQPMTEYTVGVNINGKETDIPSMVPTLTAAEVNDILNDKMTPEIVRKATEFAKARLAAGRSLYIEPGEAETRIPGLWAGGRPAIGPPQPLNGPLPPQSIPAASDPAQVKILKMNGWKQFRAPDGSIRDIP